MKIFKNFKTKRQLREEIAMLKAIKPQIHTVERDVFPVRSCVLLEENMPVEYAKEMIARQMANSLRPFIEYDVKDFYTGCEIESEIIGTLYVAKRR